MRFTKLSLFIAGAVGILILGLPRAAHAVVATLVQVSNTVAAPAITESVAEQAQQLLEVRCLGLGLNDGSSTHCNFIAPTGLAYGVPSFITISPGQNFVITSIDVEPADIPGTCPADMSASLQINSPAGQQSRVGWVLAANTGTQHFAYPSGILIAGGTEFIGLNFNSSNGNCGVLVDMFGYLTTL
jgi:hypothetical protein